MKLSKHCRQLVEQWLEEIARKYPQVRFEGLTKTPDSAVAIKLRGPEDLLEQVRISFAPRKLEALLKHRCHIIFLCLAEPPLNPETTNNPQTYAKVKKASEETLCDTKKLPW
jgi:hypothetical protein